jgi:hypothetical protein
MPDRKTAVCLTAIAATCIAAVAAMPQTPTLAIANVAVVDVVDGRIIPPKPTMTQAEDGRDAHTAGEIDVIRKSSIRIGGTSAVPGLS